MIDINHLTVEYKNGVKGLDDINLIIPSGIFGLLGENGAGKTTLMNVLTTLIPPSCGTVTIDTCDMNPQNYSQIKRMIGYLPQEIGLYPSLTVREALEYMAALMGLDSTVRKKRIDYLLEKTSLVDHQKKKNKQLSGGMKRRVGLVQALLNDPQILIVDEPTTGLDPEERIRIRNLLVDFGKERTVLFSTHVVEDLAATCVNLCILKKGKKIYDGMIQDLIQEAVGHTFSSVLNNEDEFIAFQKSYKITGKNYTERGIEIRFVCDELMNLPNCKYQSVMPTLEDSYIYKTQK